MGEGRLAMRYWGRVLALPPTSCAPLDKLLNISGPHLYHRSQNRSGTYLEECLAQHSAVCSYYCYLPTLL